MRKFGKKLVKGFGQLLLRSLNITTKVKGPRGTIWIQVLPQLKHLNKVVPATAIEANGKHRSGERPTQPAGAPSRS